MVQKYNNLLAPGMTYFTSLDTFVVMLC